MNCLTRGTANASLTLRGGLPAFGSGGAAGPAQIITYAVGFTAVVAQPLFAGQAPSAAFPFGVGGTTNYQSSAGTIVSATRQVSIAGGAFSATLTGALPNTAQPLAVRVLVVDSAGNERFFPTAAGSIVTVALLPVPVNEAPPTITNPPARIGKTMTQTGAVWAPIPPAPPGMTREGAGAFEARWLVGGVPVSTAATYVPTEAANGGALTREARSRHSLGAVSSEWSAWAASAPLTITYNAPVAAGGLANQTYTQNTGTQTVNAAPDFTVSGDADLSGVTWSVAGPAGVTISAAGVVSITTAALYTGQPVTVTATNSGDAATSAFEVTVQAAVASQLALLHSAGTEWDIHTTSEDLLGDLTFEVTIGGVTFGPFTRTAAQQVSGAAVNRIAPAIAETSPAGTYAATVGLWTHGIDPEPVPTYQWTRNASAISGATAASYATAGADDGTTLRCDVTVAGVTATSNGVVIGASADVTVSVATDGITFAGTGVTVSVATNGITFTGA